MRWLFLLLATSVPFAALACATGDAPAPGNERVATTPATDGPKGDGAVARAPEPPMPGLPRYSVPVANSELSPWSFYAVERARGTIKNGTITLRYPFPSLLSGSNEEVTLTGAYVAGQTHVEVSAGALGRGTCDLADTVWTCHEQFPGLRVDAAAARQAMVAAGLDTVEIALRLEVTASFSVDPIGIFEMSANDIENKDE